MKTIVSRRNAEQVKRGAKLLVGYLLAGYPEKDDFLELVENCESAGIDIFEIGFPSCSPFSDGEIIQKAHQKVDVSIKGDLEYWRKIRKAISKPIWLMAYRSDLIDTGFYRVLAQHGLVDALVIPDMSFDEHQRLGDELASCEVDVLGFVNPEMKPEELKECFSNTALVYQQLYSGPTGMSVVADNYGEILAEARKYNNVTVFAGFGINTPQRAAELLREGFDGAIVGTAMVRKLNDSKSELVEFVKELAASVKKAGEGNEVCGNL